MTTHPLNRLLPRIVLTAAVVSSAVSGVACTNRLKDYTQITMQASALKNNTESGAEISPESLEKAKTILENRLTGLGVELAEIETQEPNTVIVRLPQAISTEAAQTVLTNTGQLSLRNQKPDTEGDLAAGIETLQRALVEQNTLAQTGKQAEASALQPQINEARAAIASLFEPAGLTGDSLYDATANPGPNNIWDVTIQFDEEGADKFAQQTKLMAGTGRAIGLFLDDVLLSTPVVDVAYSQTGITEGSAVISGNFTKAAAKELEVQLKNGALPVRLKAVEVTSSEEIKSDEESQKDSPKTEKES